MKVLRYLVLVIASVLWLGGCSRNVMQTLYQVGVIPDDYRFGDLYRLSNLPQFKDPVEHCPPTTYPDSTRSAARTDLYIIGDSFTEPERVGKTDLPVSELHYLHWDKDKGRRIKLRSDRRNVLLIESVERHFREHVGQPINHIVIDTAQNGTTDTKPENPNWRQALIQFIKSEGIEDRLETTLFSRDLFLWFRELKATLTLNWFDRVAPTVALSSDRQALFSDLDMNPKKPLNSSFATVSDQEVNMLVDSLNRAADRYRRAGFDQVLLSIIPNKASIMEPGQRTYNHLIERIQQHPNLRLPVIDTYAAYRRSHVPVYAKGDTHWNCEGRRLWLDAVQRAL